MNVAVVNAFGFDSAGMSTLCLQYSRLGIDVYFKDVLHSLKNKMDNTYNIRFYKTDAELVKISKLYDRMIFLPPAYKADYLNGKYEKAFKFIFDIRESNKDIELWYLYCSRDTDDFTDCLIPMLKNNNFDFDIYLSICTKLNGYKDNVVCMDINAFTFDDIKPIRERKKIVFTAGRIEGFKGTGKYLNAINSEFLDSDFMYIHEGAGYSFNSKGNVSVPLQMLNFKNDDRFAFIDYGTEPVRGKLSIYPTYKIDDAYDRWGSYFAGICCIMCTNSKYFCQKFLFGEHWCVSNCAENSLVRKQAKLWGVHGLEYANIEMINAGVPLLFSRGYSELLGFKDDRLIYDSILEIPIKINGLTEPGEYEDCVKLQRQFFMNRQTVVNEAILDIFLT